MRAITVALLLWLCAAVPALGQDVAGLPLVGVLRIQTAAASEPFAGMLRNALAALGDVDGKTIRLAFLLAEGDAGRFPDMAQTLVRQKASVIIAIGLPAARAAQQATTTIPIVAAVGDLVASGLIASLAKPNGNITGESLLTPELDGKKLEVLKEMLPRARRFGVLNDRTGVLPGLVQGIADRARALGIELVPIDLQGPADLATAIASLKSAVPKRSMSPIRPCCRACATSSARYFLSISCRRSASGHSWLKQAAWRATVRPCASSQGRLPR
jgi:ABC-type uncharacterized transport system substrate-binding protein